MTEFAEGLKDSIEVIAPYLQQLAEKIGEGGTYVFSLYVKQMYIEGFSLLLIPIVGVILLVVAYRMMCSESKRVNDIKNSEAYLGAIKAIEKGFSPEKQIQEIDKLFTVSSEVISIYDGFYILTGLAGITCLINGFFKINIIIGLLFNPEYAAIRELIKQLK